jgi:phage regulator Rha-like protein
MTHAIIKSDLKNLIHHIRGKAVMLDSDLAFLYEVSTKILNQAVKRNIGRFPDDFTFQLSMEEAQGSRSQIVTLKRGQNIKYLPYAFTENGVAMLSSVLNSERAIQVNIQIMRAFTRMRNLMTENKDLLKVIQNIERRLDVHDRQIQVAFAALKSILQPPALRQKDEYSPDENKRMGFGKKAHSK